MHIVNHSQMRSNIRVKRHLVVKQTQNRICQFPEQSEVSQSQPMSPNEDCYTVRGSVVILLHTVYGTGSNIHRIRIQRVARGWSLNGNFPPRPKKFSNRLTGTLVAVAFGE